MSLFRKNEYVEIKDVDGYYLTNVRVDAIVHYQTRELSKDGKTNLLIDLNIPSMTGRAVTQGRASGSGLAQWD